MTPAARKNIGRLGRACGCADVCGAHATGQMEPSCLGGAPRGSDEAGIEATNTVIPRGSPLAGVSGSMAGNESDSSRKLAEAVLAQNSGNVLTALRFARRQERLSKKGGDSASADAWNRVAKAIALIELESIRLMLDRGPGRS